MTEVKRLVTIPGSDQIQIVITNAGNRMQVYDCRRMGGSKCVGVPMTKACMAGPKLCGSQTEEECFKQECNDDSDSNSDARTGDSLDIVYRYKLDAETSWIETQDGKPISHYWNEDWKKNGKDYDQNNNDWGGWNNGHKRSKSWDKNWNKHGQGDRDWKRSR